jgi:hypothetical protein
MSPRSARPEPDINLNPKYPSYWSMDQGGLSQVGWMAMRPARIRRYAQALQFGNSQSPVFYWGSERVKAPLNRPACAVCCVRRSVLTRLTSADRRRIPRLDSNSGQKPCAAAHKRSCRLQPEVQRLRQAGCLDPGHAAPGRPARPSCPNPPPPTRPQSRRCTCFAWPSVPRRLPTERPVRKTSRGGAASPPHAACPAGYHRRALTARPATLAQAGPGRAGEESCGPERRPPPL